MRLPTPENIRVLLKTDGQLMSRIEELMQMNPAEKKLPAGSGVNIHPTGLVRYHLEAKGAAAPEIKNCASELRKTGWLLEVSTLATGIRQLTITEDKPGVMAAWTAARERLNSQRSDILAKLDQVKGEMKSLTKVAEKYAAEAQSLTTTLAT